jgi:hypothetical protein
MRRWSKDWMAIAGMGGAREREEVYLFVMSYSTVQEEWNYKWCMFIVPMI